LTDGKSIITKVNDTYTSPTDEEFYGFGEKYNQIEQRGKTEL
jgi:glycosyl hydrolase, family 31